MILGNRSESVLLYLRDTWVEGLGLTFLFLRFIPVCRDVEAHDVKLLDLHYHGAKEAIQLLKSDLSSFSGIPCMSLDFCFYLSYNLFCLNAVMYVNCLVCQHSNILR